jgi:hypothetical protein
MPHTARPNASWMIAVFLTALGQLLSNGTKFMCELSDSDHFMHPEDMEHLGSLEGLYRC